MAGDSGGPTRSTIDLTMVYGRGDGGENMANHRRNLVDHGSCSIPKGQTITLEEWQSQQSGDLGQTHH